MQTQLTLDLTSRPALPKKPLHKNAAWLDVSDIARGVGFTLPVEISDVLNDQLGSPPIEEGDDYVQHLYDALWLAHFRLTLDHCQAITFNFSFSRKDWITEATQNVDLRLRAEIQEQVVLLGLFQDF